MQFYVENMTCGGCARSVTKAIQSVDPAAKVTADPAVRKVEVASEKPRAVFETALAQAGFPPGTPG